MTDERDLSPGEVWDATPGELAAAEERLRRNKAFDVAQEADVTAIAARALEEGRAVSDANDVPDHRSEWDPRLVDPEKITAASALHEARQLIARMSNDTSMSTEVLTAWATGATAWASLATALILDEQRRTGP